MPTTRGTGASNRADPFVTRGDEPAVGLDVGPSHVPGRRSAPSWLRPYVRSLVASDLASIVVSVLVAAQIRFGGIGASGRLPFPAMALGVSAIWMLALVTFRTYEARFLGLGSEEFERVARAATVALAVVGTGSWALRIELARGFVVIALPLAAVLTLATRYAWRRRLHARRRRGHDTQSIIIGGHLTGVLAMTAQMGRASYHGMDIIGVVLPRGGDVAATRTALAARGLRILGAVEDLAAVALRERADAVAVLPCPEMEGGALRQLGWDLEVGGIQLFVAPGVTEVIGPRIAIRPVCGLPLLHVHSPELTGIRRVAKASFDRSAAALGLLLLLPLFALVALLITADSRGGVFFLQERIGKDGTSFRMVKFRSMVTDAEARLAEIRDSSEGNAVLFKMRADPRVTRVGALLRRLSIDELPQLVNVLAGHMSLVGPRPPLAAEVALYGDDVRRRLLVKPGLTGLWQISGRSDLDWEESVRLDLRYVENWSFAYDFMILWKTIGAVFRSHGAY